MISTATPLMDKFGSHPTDEISLKLMCRQPLTCAPRTDTLSHSDSENLAPVHSIADGNVASVRHRLTVSQSGPGDADMIGMGAPAA